MDEIKLFFDTEKQNVINVAYNGASFTTFVGFNPNYRVYDVDSNTHVSMSYTFPINIPTKQIFLINYCILLLASQNKCSILNSQKF